jgi:hypothetical protein
VRLEDIRKEDAPVQVGLPVAPDVIIEGVDEGRFSLALGRNGLPTFRVRGLRLFKGAPALAAETGAVGIGVVAIGTIYHFGSLFCEKNRLSVTLNIFAVHQQSIFDRFL